MGKGLSTLVLFSSLLFSCAGSSRSETLRHTSPVIQPVAITAEPGGPRSLDESLVSGAGTSTVSSVKGVATPEIPALESQLINFFRSPYATTATNTPESRVELYNVTDTVLVRTKRDYTYIPHFIRSEREWVRSRGTALILADDNTRIRYALTASHLLPSMAEVCKQGDEKCTVTVANKPAVLVARDPENDLALLKIYDRELPFYNRCLATDFGIGDFVQGFGSHLGAMSLTEGKIGWIMNGNPRERDYFWIVGHINSGDSGGPLFVFRNGTPYFVGMSVLKFNDDDGNSSGNGGVVSAKPVARFLASYQEGGRNPLAKYAVCK